MTVATTRLRRCRDLHDCWTKPTPGVAYLEFRRVTLHALHSRDWKMAKEILSDGSNKELYFSEAEALVPPGLLGDLARASSRRLSLDVRRFYDRA